MDIEIYTGPNCSVCASARLLLDLHKREFTERDVSNPHILAEFRKRLPQQKSVPQIFIDGEHIGGYEDLRRCAENGKFSD